MTKKQGKARLQSPIRRPPHEPEYRRPALHPPRHLRLRQYPSGRVERVAMEGLIYIYWAGRLAEVTGWLTVIGLVMVPVVIEILKEVSRR